jgi:hypothetical protein
MASHCGGIESPLAGDAGGDAQSSGSGSGSSSGCGSVASSSGSSSGGGSGSSGGSASSGSSSGAWPSCDPGPGTYLVHQIDTGSCNSPQDTTVTYPNDAGLPPGCVMTEQPCAVHCTLSQAGGYVTTLDGQWTAWATGEKGSGMIETVAPDGGVTVVCGFTFTMTKQ